MFVHLETVIFSPLIYHRPLYQQEIPNFDAIGSILRIMVYAFEGFLVQFLKRKSFSGPRSERCSTFS